MLNLSDGMSRFTLFLEHFKLNLKRLAPTNVKLSITSLKFYMLVSLSGASYWCPHDSALINCQITRTGRKCENTVTKAKKSMKFPILNLRSCPWKELTDIARKTGRRLTTTIHQRIHSSIVIIEHGRRGTLLGLFTFSCHYFNIYL